MPLPPNMPPHTPEPAPRPVRRRSTPHLTQLRAAPKAPRRRKRALIALVALTLTGALLTAGVLTAHAVAEDYIADTLYTRSAAMGWDIQWRDLSLDYDLTLNIHGLFAEGPAQSSVLLDTLTIQWTVADLLQGAKIPASVRIQGFSTDLDVGALRAWAAEQRAAASSPSAPAAATPDADARAAARRARLAQLDVAFQGGTVQLRNLPEGIDDVRMDQVALWGAPLAADHWVGNYDARCQRGCGPSQRASGTVKHHQGAWRANLDLSRALPVPVPVPGQDDKVLDVRVKHLYAALEANGEDLTLGARDLTVPIEARGHAGTLNVRSVTVKTTPQDLRHPRAIVLDRPALTLQRAQPRLGAAPAAREGAAMPDLPAPAKLRALVLKHLPRVQDITVLRGDLHLPDRGLRISQIHAKPSGDAWQAEGTLNDLGRVGVTLQTTAPEVTVNLKQLHAQPYASRLLPVWGDRIDGVLTGQVRLDLSEDDPDPTYRVDAEIQVEQGRFEHPKITPTGIHGQDAQIHLNAAYRLPGAKGDRLEIKTLTLDLPSRVKGRTARLNASGTFTHLLNTATPATIDAHIWLDETPCDIAVGAIPRGMLPHIWDQIRLSGHFAPRVDVSVDLADTYTLKLDIKGLPGTCKVTDLGKYSPKYLADRFSQEVREGVTRPGIFVGPDSGAYAGFYHIPRYVTAAMYLSEEAAFYSNKGFALSLIRRAVRLNLEKRRYVYGGSSIEQQLVKNLFLTRQKTLSRKLEEAFIVWRMEHLLPKNRIIELYMNCIEFGVNLYGIRRAARYYFNKTPRQLTPLEGTFLAALKPFPPVGNAARKAGHTPHDGWWNKRIGTIMGRLLREGFISRKQYLEAQPFVVYFPGHEPPADDDPDAAADVDPHNDARQDDSDLSPDQHPTSVFEDTPSALPKAPPLSPNSKTRRYKGLGDLPLGAP